MCFVDAFGCRWIVFVDFIGRWGVVLYWCGELGLGAWMICCCIGSAFVFVALAFAAYSA